VIKRTFSQESIMSEPVEFGKGNSGIERLAQLEERVRRLEERLALHPADDGEPILFEESEVPETPRVKKREKEEFEFEVGQNWFAKVGIVVLAVGMVFALSIPYESLPSWLPTMFGYVLVGVLVALARAWRNTFELVSAYLRGSGMALSFFATLRLFYFSPVPALAIDTLFGIALLVVVVLLNFAVALRRQSPYLTGLSIVMGYACALAVGTPAFVLSAFAVLAALAAATRLMHNWRNLLLFVIPVHYFAYVLWIFNNPVLSGDIRYINEPFASAFFLLLYGVIFAMGTLLRKTKDIEAQVDINSSFLNAGGAYGLFLLQTVFSFKAALTGLHLLASALLLALAIVFWVRERSRYSTFVYSMLGYAALSVAILQAFAVPDVFVWLSVQSLIVVGTAVWFRSRIIIVANFGIYIAILVGYVFVAQQESGISLVFGIVALVSARILNLLQHRLELKTELMRNAYLFSAFVALPYSLYHLVPREFVSLSWVGIALFYYLMHVILKVQKYRWLGHFTLLLTVLYVVVIGIIQLPPTIRVFSFLVLGLALVIVSLVYTKLRARKRATESKPEEILS
jgi:uncharacterized membrane protein